MHPIVPPGYWHQHGRKRNSTATREALLVTARDRQRMFREEPNPASQGGGEARSSDDTG